MSSPSSRTKSPKFINFGDLIVIREDKIKRFSSGPGPVGESVIMVKHYTSFFFTTTTTIPFKTVQERDIAFNKVMSQLGQPSNNHSNIPFK